MKKKILIFRTDRVGDLINTSSFLKSLKFNYQNSEIILVCSKYNSVIAKNYEFIDKVLIYDKSYNLLKKIIFILKFFFLKFDVSIAIDGKNISYLISIIANAKEKYAVCFKKKKYLLGFSYFLYRPSLIMCNLFFHTHIVCNENYFDINSNKDFKNHYSTMFFYLFKKNNINLIPQGHIFNLDSKSIEKSNNFFNNFINSKHLVFHIDSKWDVYNINIDEFNKFLNDISVKFKIIITTGIEDSKFVDQLKSIYKKYYFNNNNINESNKIESNIFLLDKLDINLLGAFISKSDLFISSHSGAPLHIAAAFNIPIIDFIKKEKELEYNRWIPLNVKYFRANINNLSDLKKIVLDLN